ncbi:hypothetical protein FRC09_017251, partial [Ceratobasidium sp. 395]
MSNEISAFTAAVLPLFRVLPEMELINRFDDILALNSYYSNQVIEYRANIITDFRGYAVPSAVERLVRWDYRHPDIIFNEGFWPHVVPSDESEIVPENADLGAYVDFNFFSVFVSTARTYADPSTGLPTRWVPDYHDNAFEYEVFAAGGIDVNYSLGRVHQYWDEHEITFPGGIRPEFI